MLVRADGAALAVAEAAAGDGSWLGTLGGACAVGDFLLAPTDDGVVRLEAAGGRIFMTKAFPDTEPFVDAGSVLLPAPGGLAVVGPREVRILAIR